MQEQFITSPGVPRNQDSPKAPPRCECTNTAIRQKTCSDKRIQFVRQCLDCGRTVGGPLPKSTIRVPFSVPPFDTSLVEKRDQQWQEYRDATSLRAVQTAAEWWEAYDKYRLTPEWRDKRDKVLERDKHLCQAQLSGCSSKALSAHHLSYKHLFHEPLFDLVAICKRCHDQLHADRSRIP